MAANQKTFEDLSLVLNEANRFIDIVNNVGLTAIPKDDVLYSLNRLGRPGILIIGRRGSSALSRAAKRELQSRKTLFPRTSVDTFRRCLERNFLDLVVQRKLPLDKQTCDKIIDKSVFYIEKNKLKDRKHFFPCIISTESSVDTFRVGPVTFQTTSSFFKDYDNLILKHTSDVEGLYREQEKNRILKFQKRIFPEQEDQWPLVSIKRISATFENDLRANYSTYRWIASVQTNQFGDGISETVGRYAVESALNILRLFIGASHAKQIRLGGGFRAETRSVSVSLNETENLRIALSSSSEDAILGKNWLDTIFSDQGEYWIATAGSLINALLSGSSMAELHRKYLDALWWYGEAVSEPHAHAKVVRYSSSLESLLVTNKKDIAEQIALRGAYLCCCDDAADTSAIEWHHKLKSLYDRRSALVHGNLSPLDPDNEKFAWLGERLTRKILMQGLGWWLWMAHERTPHNLKAIEECYDLDLPLFSQGIF